jgi:hypothetical protein
MLLENPLSIVQRLRAFQSLTRNAVIRNRHSVSNSSDVTRHTAADTIYAIDATIEPLLEEFCRDWAETTPLVLIAEGIENEHGVEGVKVFPEGTSEADAKIRLIVDPIDGTRGLMYDKRAAWALAGVAPNKGSATRLSDIEVAVMTELPTSKMGSVDVLWAIRGQGANGVRVKLDDNSDSSLTITPSRASGIEHGFASISNFFPGTKTLSAALMETIAQTLLGELDVRRAMVFDDQYISTAGQLYELIVGHDRFNADLRPVFYRMQNQPTGLCCHPYDCAAMLIATEAGVELTNEHAMPLDGPLDVTTGIAWLGYANAALRRRIEPIVMEFLKR